MSSKVLRQVVEEITRDLVSAEHRASASFIRTPLRYPSGSTVVVRIEDSGGDFFVSDAGFGFQEADMMGAARIFPRHARVIAEAGGVGFDNHSFFVSRVHREQLPGAVIAVANCSLQAAALSAQRFSQERSSEFAESVVVKLVRIFGPERVKRRVEIYGASSTPYEFAAVVKPPEHNVATVFEPVINHPSSVAHAAQKFNDVSRTENPPHLVAVVHGKEQFGTLLNVLAQSAHVIDDRVPNQTFEKLALAA